MLAVPWHLNQAAGGLHAQGGSASTHLSVAFTKLLGLALPGLLVYPERPTTVGSTDVGEANRNERASDGVLLSGIRS